MQIIRHRKHAVNISEAERIVSAIGGGLLAALAIDKRPPGSFALGLAGGAMMCRALTGHSLLYEALGFRTAKLGQGRSISVPYELGIRVDESITLDVPRAEAFRFWRDFSNLPRFMRHVQSVVELSNGRSHWVVQAPAGRTVEWDAVIHNLIDGELIAWRSLPGAGVDHAGSVWFHDADGGRATEIRVALQYNPPAGMVGAAWAALWGQEPSRQMSEDLRALKKMFRRDGYPSRQDVRHSHGDNRAVDLASEDSFPASDAPAYSR